VQHWQAEDHGEGFGPDPLEDESPDEQRLARRVEFKRRIAERCLYGLVELRRAEKRADRRLKRLHLQTVDARRATEAALRGRVEHHLAEGWPEDAAQALAEGDTADLNYEADIAAGEAEAAVLSWIHAHDDVADARFFHRWERARAERAGVTGSRSVTVTVAARPRGCDRQARPRARRTGSSSRTSGSDPGSGDGETEPPPPLGDSAPALLAQLVAVVA